MTKHLQKCLNKSVLDSIMFAFKLSFCLLCLIPAGSNSYSSLKKLRLSLVPEWSSLIDKMGTGNDLGVETTAKVFSPTQEDWLVEQISIYYTQSEGAFGQNDVETDTEDFQTGILLRGGAKNGTKYGCIYKPMNNHCPDSDINFYYYPGHGSKQRKQKINPTKKSSLSETSWDPQKHNIVFIHGYGGSDGSFPNYIVRDAYVRNGSYNVFVVDWSPLARIPCYTAAVNNLHPVAKCTGNFYQNLRQQGVPSNRITCVGHSLGAHGCGLVSNYINFRMHRIVGLDPAGPMIPSSSRLRSGMADSVQVMHTNAGTFGDSTSGGRVNFCYNGGKTQPYCDSNAMGLDLCSHILVVCYWAESIDGATARKAQPCTRQCPYGPRQSHRSGHSIMVGEHTPDKASGSYCVYTQDPPYCPKGNGGSGHPWCCLGKKTGKQERQFAKQWNKHKPK